MTEAYGKSLAARGWQADLVTANNVLAHVPDINDFVRGIAAILKPEGVATFEVQHLLRLMQGRQFDTIYHEHFSYLSLLAAERLFDAAGLRVFAVDNLPTHGGSVRFFVCRKEAERPNEISLDAMRAEELEYGLDKPETYRAWRADILDTKFALLELLLDLKKQGKTIVGYGAPAKGVTLLNYCGIDVGLHRLHRRPRPFQEGLLLPRGGRPNSGPRRDPEHTARLCPYPSLEPEGRDQGPDGSRTRLGRQVHHPRPQSQN